MTIKTATALLGLLLLGIFGCSSSEPVEEAAATEVAPAATEVEQAIDVAAVEAMLALADRADGTEDRVVARCAACALGMDGSPEHMLEAHGYEMHFCSAGCKDGFAENTDEAILAMALTDEPSEPVEN
jgi:hypothetical protein